jgi:DNA-binding transcriptional MerR regulator
MLGDQAWSMPTSVPAGYRAGCPSLPAMDPDALRAAATDLGPLDPPDAALAAVVTAGGDDLDAPFDLDALAAHVGTTRTLLEAVGRAGLLLPHHIDADGTARYSEADARAVRAGLTLLDAGLPLAELLDIATRTDAAMRTVAEHAVEAFLRFVRDPVRGTIADDDEAAARLLTAYERMLPATEVLVAHHLRRCLVARAVERVAEEAAGSAGAT